MLNVCTKQERSAGSDTCLDRQNEAVGFLDWDHRYRGTKNRTGALTRVTTWKNTLGIQ